MTITFLDPTQKNSVGHIILSIKKAFAFFFKYIYINWSDIVNKILLLEKHIMKNNMKSAILSHLSCKPATNL